MNIEIDQKINKIIDLLEHNKSIIRYKEITNKINEEESLKQLLNDFNNMQLKYLENNSFSQELISLKKKVYDNMVLKEYYQLINSLNIIILLLNQKLDSLVNTKKCGI